MFHFYRVIFPYFSTSYLYCLLQFSVVLLVRLKIHIMYDAVIWLSDRSIQGNVIHAGRVGSRTDYCDVHCVSLKQCSTLQPVLVSVYSKHFNVVSKTAEYIVEIYCPLVSSHDPIFLGTECHCKIPTRSLPVFDIGRMSSRAGPVIVFAVASSQR